MDRSLFFNLTCGALALLAGCAPLSSFAAETEPGVRFVSSPPTDRRNDHYVSNRAPLSPTPLVQLPIKAIEPRGWLRKELELQADGFHGHYGEISRFLKKENNSWLDPNGKGDHGWEEVPYWLKGFSHCAYLLENPKLIKEAQIWIEGAIGSQQPDGWFGPQRAKPTVKSTDGEYDLWPNMIMLFCLQSYYDHSQDVRVLELMRKYFRWELAFPEDKFLPPIWQQQRAADNLWSVYWLYNRTGETWLLELASKIHRRTADWTDGIASLHNVNIAQAFNGPAIYWQQSHDPRHYAAAERNWQSVRAEYGQVPGGMFGADEQCRTGYGDPRQAIETCGIVEEMLSDEQMLQVGGDMKWADRGEDAAYNSLTAALTADLKAVRYLTAPNQPLSDTRSKAPGIRNAGAMYLMSPTRYRCCQHNFGQGWPYLASSLWFATSDNGLAAVFYSESEVTAKVGPRGTEVRISESTHYPFDESVRLTVSTTEEVRFPLYLRVPGWCQAPVVTVNGLPMFIEGAVTRTAESSSSDKSNRASILIDRKWRKGDIVELTLPMRLVVRRWEKNHDSVSIDRGPLTYSLKIEEDYEWAGGSDEWPSWEIRPASPWNYGLVLDETNATSSFSVVTRDWPADNMPFTQKGTPILLKAKGRRISSWKLDERGLVEELQQSPVLTHEPVEPITLVPMGAARLRISAFPVASDEPKAHEWGKSTH